MNKENTYIGCSGFSNNDWKGTLYPEDAKSKDFLMLYSQQFNAVEINSTFYRKPTAKTLQKWFDETPHDFRFFIKIPKTITHEKHMENCTEDIAEFYNHIQHRLKEKLAGFLYQFPPSFKKNEENLKLIVKNIDISYLNVIEFRHESWWNAQVYKSLQENKIIFSGVSFPGKLPDDVMINSDEILYYRLHGKPILYKSEYSQDFLDDLAEKIRNSNLKSYIFFNNTWGVSAIKNGIYLQKIGR
nr:DUF72 domain-containing protein [uncultured Chryseobacterium sp.]